MIMNHVSHFDWMYFWSVVDRHGDLSYWKPVTKRRPLRSLPILGELAKFRVHSVCVCVCVCVCV